MPAFFSKQQEKTACSLSFYLCIRHEKDNVLFYIKLKNTNNIVILDSVF